MNLVKSLAGRVAVLLLRALARVRPIRLCYVRTDRIGHMAVTELFIRQRKAGQIDPAPLYVFWTHREDSARPANLQLFDMINRELPIVRSWFLFKLTALPFVRDSEFIYRMPSNSLAYKGAAKGPPGLAFTDDEIRRGLEGLAKLGIGREDWFVCFQNRDMSYLEKTFPGRDWSYHRYRNHAISDMKPAMQFVASQGGFAVRMGAEVGDKLEASGPRVIDYANSGLRSDFLDIFLLSRCRFIISGTAGLVVVALAFNVPVGLVNFIPLNNADHYPFDAFIPKRVRDGRKGRELRLRDIWRSEARYFMRTQQFEKAGLEVIDNSPGEILAFVREMHARTEGQGGYSPEDQALQRSYWEILGHGEAGVDGVMRIGRDFLREHSDYLR